MNLFVVFIVFGEVFAGTFADIHRSKRFLIFPPTSPTRMQLIAGIGIPTQLEYESVTFGYTLKAEYFLADNTTITGHFNQDPWNPITRPITNRRRRHALLFDKEERKETHDPIEKEANNFVENNSTTDDRYEKYDVEAIEIDSGLIGVDTDEDDEPDEPDGDDMDERDEIDEIDDEDDEHEENDVITASKNFNANPKDLSTARWTLFRGMETLAQRKGLSGRACMLRSICESAQAPFSVKSGILGELMHIIMTPSLTQDTIIHHTQNEYLHAEQVGRSGAPCDKVFKECTTSVLDQISGIYSTVDKLIKLFG